jgi:hypothetical protein
MSIPGIDLLVVAGISVAAAAAAAASQSSSQRRTAAVAAMEANRKPPVFAGAELQAAMAQLKHVTEEEKRAAEAAKVAQRSAAGGDSLQSALVQGLAKFQVAEDEQEGDYTDTLCWSNS